jgi:hypothetical protein
MSAIIIFISHHLYEFYISSHSPPKLRDIQNERNAEYEMLRKMVPMVPRGRGGHSIPIDDDLPYITQHVQHKPVDSVTQPSPALSDPSVNDKDALKEFMRQMNTDTPSDSTPL